ncbi:MAG: IPT/TIG domain-containing protein [Opitutus sp.]
MHTNRISPARRIILGLASVLTLVLAGCNAVTLTNLTPASMPENPSHIYTFTLRVASRTNTVPPQSVVPHIVLDGRNHQMNPSSIGEGLYEFEYQLPPGREEVAYYYLVNFNVEGNTTHTPQEAYTNIETVRIARRYVHSLEVNRGPVGSRISVVGRGFTPQDTIDFDGTPARTVFESPNALSFYVPPVEPNRNYTVTVRSVASDSPVGTFRVDPTSITVFPTSLTLQSGQQQLMSFTLPNPAPAGGSLIDVTTDVPESIIMPEILVAQGQTQVTVNVEGGQPGQGSLFLRGYGAGEITIPVTVTPR